MTPSGGWHARTSSMGRGTIQQISIAGSAGDLSFGEVVDGWRHDEAFRHYFCSLLAAAPYDAFFWETPPVSAAALDRRFEFVLIDAPQLTTVPADPDAFADRFATEPERDSVITFPNRGGDAVLIVPRPIKGSTYPHLAAFTRNAPAPQRDRLWRVTGEALADRVEDRPIWLSTAGLGVCWLHLRLDSRPKYYRHRPYAESG